MYRHELHITVVSNIIFEPYLIPSIKRKFGQNVIVFPVPYGEHMEEEYKKQIATTDLLVIWINLESLFPDIWNELFSHKKIKQELINSIIDLCERLRCELSAISKGKMLWLLFEDYYTQFYNVFGSIKTENYIIDSINNILLEKFNEKMVLIDLKLLIASVGVYYTYNNKGKYRWNAPYSKILIEAVVDEIHNQYLIEKCITKKCLVLDGDNVLWGGILSEDSMENIKLGGSGFGRAYQDFQRVVLSLYYNGVILAICSKNDLSDVMTVFRNHNEMIIKEEHIACFQVNWDDKINNIKLIAETLNIGFDSIVFVDDSTIEVEAVRSIFPEVTSIRFDCNSIYKDLSCFKLHSNVNFTDIENRNTTYRTNKLRESLKDQYKSYDDYITALDIRLDIHEAMPIEYNRISELTQRTNKCTNGKRYSVTEIKEKVKSKDFKLYSVLVSDKFSNLGLVGAVGVDGKTLDLFSLSCRSLGRKIEDKMISFIRQHHIITQIDFKLTDKNKNIKAIFTSIIN